MTKLRVPETDHGIQGDVTVAEYDRFQQHMCDKGFLRWNDLLEAGIVHGHALEIGPGPGRLGLEWLAHTNSTCLTGLDISPDMITLAEKNAHTYALSERTEYVLSSGDDIPFDDNHFDAVFTNGSLHEWVNPRETHNEIWRVLKPGGHFHISDLRRDLITPIRWMMWLTCKPSSIRPGFTTSLEAAYTPDELRALVSETALKDCTVESNPFGVKIHGMKE